MTQHSVIQVTQGDDLTATVALRSQEDLHGVVVGAELRYTRDILLLDDADDHERESPVAIRNRTVTVPLEVSADVEYSRILVRLPAELTSDMRPGDHAYAAWLTWPGTPLRRTVVRGVVNVDAEVGE